MSRAEAKRKPPGAAMTVAEYKGTESEAAFQIEVVKRAHEYGWLVASFRRVTVQGRRGVYYATPVQADGGGWPDLFCVRGKRAVAAELKSKRGKLSLEQERWLLALGTAGVEVYEWRNTDWPEIDKVLAK